MTAGEPLADGLGPDGALVGDDTEGCLCLVAGYAKKDGLIARVTAEAERQVMMSPALDDFLQLRYVDLGPPPDQVVDWSGSVRRIVADLMTVQETAGRSHFALIVIAKSAVTIEELLGSCAADPFLARLRLRSAGIASSDDREQENGLVEITSSPSGAWQDERELTGALRQRCEELPRYFATRGEPGVTRAGFAALRRAHAQGMIDGDGPEGDAAVSDAAAVPDLLDDVPEAAGTASGTAPGQDAAPADDEDAPARFAAGHRSAVSVFRWRPEIPWRREKQAGDQRAATAAGPSGMAMGIVYLLMVVEQDAAPDPALDHLRAAILGTDRRLGAQSFCRYQVRVVHGRDRDLRGELHEAGKLGRRATKRQVKTDNFAAVLKVIRSSLRRDHGLVQTMATAAGLTTVPPAVVIFTADPPMADLGAAAVFGELATEARVVWVVPEGLEGLVSPAFGPAGGAKVLGEHQGVPDEILDAMDGEVLAS